MIRAQINGDKSVFEKYLADNYGFFDAGMHKSMDRTKAISKIKANSTFSKTCGNYQLIPEGDKALLKSVCSYTAKELVFISNIKAEFTHRFAKFNGQWKLVYEEKREIF